MNPVSHFLWRATRSRSTSEDRARREFIFNVLCLGALGLLLSAIIDDTMHRIVSDPAMHKADSIASFALYAIFAFVAFLYALSLRGRALIASFLLLTTIFDLAVFMGYRWGVDVSASPQFYALAIVMSGILISAEFAFVTATLAGIAIGITVHFHNTGLISPDRSWITELWKSDDVVISTIIFIVIALAMWLSNREIERSLMRARQSEADLMVERDSLEVRVEERTKELRQAELERMTQAYRFVEFGRLASGVFHDLMNPLAGLSLNIERIADASGPSRNALTGDVERAKRAATHMQDLLISMRRHLKQESHEEVFSLEETVTGALQLINTHACAHSVECVLEIRQDAHVFGNPVALTQALLNLIGNAIQSYPPGVTDTLRFVHVSVERQDNEVCMRITDQGVGISPDILERIFEPYFTTKGEVGIGLGLSLTKRILEKDFSGRILVESAPGQGTMFTLYLPIREP